MIDRLRLPAPVATACATPSISLDQFCFGRQHVGFDLAAAKRVMRVRLAAPTNVIAAQQAK
jgi:hypothetical protein